MSTITKKILVSKISFQTGHAPEGVVDIINCFMQNVTASLIADNDVVLRNFGRFQTRKNSAKIGRNPKNPGTAIHIPERTVVKFIPGKFLKESISSASKEVKKNMRTVKSVKHGKLSVNS